MPDRVQQIDDPIVAQPVGPGDPPAPQAPVKPRPGVDSHAKASAQREYVAAGSFSPALASYYRTLPRLLDNVELQAGEDVYDRMLQDAIVKAVVNLLKMSVLSQDVELTPPVDDQDKDYKQARKVCDFCTRAIGRIPHFRGHVLFEMLDAVAYGHRVGEMVYAEVESGPDKGKLTPKAIKIKPRSRYAFLVDPFMNVAGLLGVIPGKAPWLLSTIVVGDPATLPNLLPRSKFCILTLLQKEGDVRGLSWLNAAYNPWFLKMQMWPEYLRYLMQFASPSLLGILSEKAGLGQQLNPDGTSVTDADGNPVMANPTQTLMNSLMAFRNSTALVVANGTEVKPLYTYGDDGGAFRTGIDTFNREITQSILFQTLATQEGRHESRAASQIHQDIMEIPIQFLRTAVEEMIRRDMLTPWILYNFGPDALEFLPRVSLGDTEQQNFAAKATAVAQLMSAGFLDPSQMREIDNELGLPIRSPEDVEARRNPPPPAARAPALGMAGDGAVAGAAGKDVPESSGDRAAAGQPPPAGGSPSQPAAAGARVSSSAAAASNGKQAGGAKARLSARVEDIEEVATRFLEEPDLATIGRESA